MNQPQLPPPHNPSAGGQSESNPFRSERLRPGVVPYLFPDGQTVEDLVDRLQSSHWRGEIVGPHGTGKSTLIHALLPRLASRGFSVWHGSFCGGEKRWSELPAAGGELQVEEHSQRIVVIDGFEQLAALARWKWQWLTYLRGQGLIVTTHDSVGLPSMHHTSVPVALAQEIAQRIAGDELGGLTAGDVTSALESHHGNMRDALFALYDRIEAERY